MIGKVANRVLVGFAEFIDGFPQNADFVAKQADFLRERYQVLIGRGAAGGW